MVQTAFVWGLGAAMALIYLRSGRPVRSVLGSAISGGICLWLVRATSALTGITLALNGASAFFALLLGAPGVISLAVLRGILSV